MNSPSQSPVATSGRQIVSWLTVLQVLSVVSAVAYVVLALLGRSQAGVQVSRTVDLSIGGLQVLLSVLWVLAIQVMKRWMTDVRHWATGDGAPNAERTDRDARTLRGWLLAGQLLPILAAFVIVPLTWYAIGIGLDTAEFQDQLRRQSGGQNLPPETLRAAVQLGSVLTLVFFVVPSIAINWAVLGWVRRWTRGVTDAVAGRPLGEPRLADVAGTLARWFTFFQALLVLVILMVLAVPLVGLPQETGLDRVSLVVYFLLLSLQVALLQWSKTFLAGVTQRAAGVR
ncbi:hypothetical protein [Deinococcus pimensis]|uniref:hypothetical protein n=1 Tax=Deinococcus pimensis TaxID=309888 RepID=UPI0004847B27|nr:hypothetical protein [Deinococcus pimensis]